MRARSRSCTVGPIMAKRRNRRPSKRIARGSSTNLPQAAQVIGFTEQEEAFFRLADTSTFEHLDEQFAHIERPSLLRRLFSRVAVLARAA
jgi:hypothetical protein